MFAKRGKVDFVCTCISGSSNVVVGVDHGVGEEEEEGEGGGCGGGPSTSKRKKIIMKKSFDANSMNYFYYSCYLQKILRKSD